VREASPVRPWTILGVGLVVASLTALTPLLLGDAVLENAKADWDLPALGHVHATSATIFDIGVYLVVVGLMLMVFEAFGDDPEPGDPEAGEGSAA
jgi:multisubunit Na+/H+ antiporter MnhB subunit